MSISTPMQFKLGSAVLCLLALLTGCAHRPDFGNSTPIPKNNNSAGDSRMKNNAEIRELVDGFVKAIRAKDIDGVMAVFASDVVSFDFGPPLQHGGGADFVKAWQELFDLYQGPIDYEVRDLHITADDEVAFSHSLNRISGTTKNNQRTERWLRWTACYRRTNGAWLIVHEQVSVPVDAKTAKALLDLKP